MMTSKCFDSDVMRIIYQIKLDSPDLVVLEPSILRFKEDMIRFNIFPIKVAESAYIVNRTYPLCGRCKNHQYKT